MAWHLHCLGFFQVDNLLAFLLERLTTTEYVTAFFFFFFLVDKSGENMTAFFFLFDKSGKAV